jgi:hypothetical protein
MAQQKEAYACMDFACHGTKMSSLICGQPVTLHDLGLTDDYVQSLTGRNLASFLLTEQHKVRLGIAPRASLGVVGVLGGELLAETGVTSQIIAGLNWAAESHVHGFRIVNISIEVDPNRLDDDTRLAIAAVFDLMRHRGMVTIAACGNHGSYSAPVGPADVIVGAADSEGNPWPRNGRGWHVLAPGVDVLCGQPRLDRLGNLQIEAYTGTSIATAIVSGAVAALASRHRDVPVHEVADALKRTAKQGMIDLGGADAAL